MTTDVVALASDLMACPSITPNDAGCQTLLREQLEALGFECESMRFGEVENLWARFGTQKPLFVFAGHTDVVPTGPASEWTTPPFTPSIRAGFLYGRGATDMKGALAAMVIATGQFLKNHPTFPGSIGFLITSDEEGPSLDGTKRVMETLTARQEKLDYCLIGEPSTAKTIGDQIRVGRRGSLHGTATIHGKQGHVAHPHLADNPIHRSAPALHELTQTVWDNGNADFPPTSLQITNIHSGTGAANMIPGHMEVKFNFRFSTAVTPTELKERVMALFDKHQLKVDCSWTIGAEPFLTQAGKLRSATADAVKSITGQTVTCSTGGGTSDGRFIAPTGTEVIELGTLHATAHQIDECISVDELNTLVKIYEQILTNVFS